MCARYGKETFVYGIGRYFPDDIFVFYLWRVYKKVLLGDITISCFPTKQDIGWPMAERILNSYGQCRMKTGVGLVPYAESNGTIRGKQLCGLARVSIFPWRKRWSLTSDIHPEKRRQLLIPSQWLIGHHSHWRPFIVSDLWVFFLASIQLVFILESGPRWRRHCKPPRPSPPRVGRSRYLDFFFMGRHFPTQRKTCKAMGL